MSWDIVQATVVHEGRLKRWHETNYVKVPVVFGFTLIDGTNRLGDIKNIMGKLVERHSALRMFFPMSDPTLAAVTRPGEVNFTLERFEAEATDYDIVKHLERGFDLSVWPLFRVCLQVRGDNVLVGFAVDHSVFDGESLDIFVREFAVLWTTDKRSWEECLHPVASFAEFGTRQRRWLASAEGRKELDFWLRLCERYGVFPEIKGRTIPDIEPTDDRVAIRLDRERFAENCRKSRATPFQLLANASLRAQPWVPDSVGVTFATLGRSWLGLESAIGNFANHVPIWLESPIFSLGDVRDSILDALTHEMVPYSAVITEVAGAAYWAKPERDHPPYLFLRAQGTNILFSEVHVSREQTRPYKLPYTGSKFDSWTIDLLTQAGELSLRCMYNSSIDGLEGVEGLVQRIAMICQENGSGEH